MSETVVVVVADADILASTVAARLVIKIIDAQAERGWAGVVLTGGRIAAKVLRSVKELPAADAIDWSHVELWWGDERFLPAGDPERNDTQARDALLAHVPVDPDRVRPMPGPDGPDGPDAGAAAARYASWLAAAATPEDHGPVPAFDVLLLGMGDDGHTASLFPGHPGVYDDRPVLAVHGSPKPPPTRLSLSFDSINAAKEVWMVVSGAQKARGVALAMSGAGRNRVPAAGVEGRQRTLWLLDAAAAAQISVGGR
jgi:6-phosphogluconolactonase